MSFLGLSLAGELTLLHHVPIRFGHDDAGGWYKILESFGSPIAIVVRVCDQDVFDVGRIETELK